MLEKDASQYYLIGVENKIEDSPYDDDGDTTSACKRYFRFSSS